MQRALCVLVILSVAGSVHAQSRDSSTIAEQLFNEGRKLARSKRWAEACPKFEASLNYEPVLGTRLNLAICYEHVGKLASAWGLYRELMLLAKKAGDVKRARYAQKQAAALEPRLPRLAISAPARPPEGFVVMRDGTPIDPGAQGVALFVDPGAHEITASAPGFEAFTRTVTIVEGMAETLAIPDLKPVPAAPVAQAPVAPGRIASAGPARERVERDAVTAQVVAPSRTRTYVAIGAGAAGVAALGVGLVFGARARSTYGDAEALCGADLVCDPASYEKGDQIVRDARSTATVSTVFVAAGGAAIVGATVLWLTTPRARERAARLVPVSHDRGAGIAVAGRF
jgi:hypothetical protein